MARTTSSADIGDRIDRLAEAVESLRRDLSAALDEVRTSLTETRTGRPRAASEAMRVGLFVDVQNMYYAARQVNARLDYGALMSTVTRDRRLIKATAYVVQNRDIDQSSFLSMLQQKNYEVRRKSLKIRQDGSSKGDWDMEMALDILRIVGSLDVVVLVTGDGDFVSLVTRIKELGPSVEVYSFPESTAHELMEAADRHIPIGPSLLMPMPSP